MGNEVYYGGTIPAYINNTMGLIVPWVYTFDKSPQPVLHACNVQDAAGYVNLAKIQDNFAGINYGEQIYSSIHSKDSYRVNIPGTISLSVISPSGRKIHCLTNTYHKTGIYSTEWNAMNRSGVYFFVLKTMNDKMIRKAFIVH